MDVHDIPDAWTDTTKAQKQILQRAKLRRGERPRDWKPAQLVYQEFMMTLYATQNDKSSEENHFKFHTSFIPPAYLPCTTPVADLRGIKIRDLRLETHHRGTCILLRAITPPNRMTAIMVLVEDDRADVVMMQLYQQEQEDVRKAVDLVNSGMIFILKEPYLKIMASGEYGLRVDHLSDLIHVGNCDPKVPHDWRPRITELDRSADSLKLQETLLWGLGNTGRQLLSQYEPLLERHMLSYVRSYSEALSRQPTSDEIAIIKRNRSLTYLKTQQFDAALSDTGFPEFSMRPTEKALFRAAEALYSLKRFVECFDVLGLLCDAFPENQQAKAIRERTSNRVSEEASGSYDFKRLQAEAKKMRPPQLDHATYIGPVEVRHTKKKGRGLFLTRAVKAGDLLLCEKAFGHAYATHGDDSSSSITLLMNLETDRGFMGGQADLISIIAQKLYKNPSVTRQYTSLYCGDYEPVSVSIVDGMPIVDTFLIERIMSLNVFGCPTSSIENHKDLLANRSTGPTAYKSCGIWTQASYINHNCASTARRAFIGDMMIVRATKDLDAETEITFWYHNPIDKSIDQLQKKLGAWGFVCDCVICLDAQETTAPVNAQRRKLLASLKKLCDRPTLQGIQAQKIEKLLRALNDTYKRSTDEVPRFTVWDPQMLLVRIYLAQENMGKGLEAVGKVLAALSFSVIGLDSSSVSFNIVKWGVVLDHVVELFLHARTIFQAIGAKEDALRAESYAKVAYRIVVGEDATFGSIYGEK